MRRQIGAGFSLFGLALLLCAQDSGLLQLREPVTGTLKAGESKVFYLNLRVKEFALLTVEQMDADLAIRVSQGGNVLVLDEFELGTELIPVFAEIPGSVRIEVQARQAAHYSIRLEFARQVTASDRQWLDAVRESTSSKARIRAGSATDLQEAAAADERALGLWRALHEPRGEARTLIKIGDVRYVAGDLFLAREAYAEARAICAGRQDVFCASEASNNLGMCEWGLGNPDPAEEDFNQALAGWTTYPFPFGRAATLNNLGLLYWQYSGEWQKAATHYREAAKIFHGTDARGEAVALNNAGLVYLSLAEYTQALYYLESARILLTGTGNRGELGRTLINLARAYLLSGGTAKALAALNQAWTWVKDGADDRARADVMNNKGQALVRLNRTAEAVTNLRKAAAIYRRTGDRVGLASSTHHLGVAAWRNGDLDRAQAALVEALESRRALRLLDDQAETLYTLARLERQRGDVESAIGHLHEAMDVAESLRTRAESQAFRVSFFSSKQDYYRLCIELLMDQNARRPGLGFDREAFATAERARARSLMDSMNESATAIRRGAEPQLLAREAGLRKKLRYQSQRLSAAEPGSAQEGLLRSAVDRLIADLHQLDAEIRTKNPAYAELVEPRPASLGEIQRDLLDSDSLLLEYALGDSQSFVWAVSKDQFQSYPLPPGPKLERDAKRFVQFFADRPRGRMAKEQNELERYARLLGSELLGPLAATIAGRKLAIVGEGILQYVPFTVLTISSAGHSAKLGLLEEIVTLPSASSALLARRATQLRARPTRDLALVADPVFDPHDSRVKPPPEGLQDKNAAILPRLSSGRAEAQCIAGMCPRERCLGVEPHPHALFIEDVLGGDTE